jgi:hypothetical protein
MQTFPPGATMTFQPKAYGKKRHPTFFIDDAQRRLRLTARWLARAVSTASYPLGDILALVRRRLHKLPRHAGR